MLRTSANGLYDVSPATRKIAYGHKIRQTGSSAVFRPAIQPGGVYTRRQLQHNLNISDKTFAKWLNAGLEGL